MNVSVLLRSLFLVTSVAAIAACADDAPGAPADLSAEARVGYDLALANGCFACHGAEGTGGVAAAWTGLAGTEVELVDGSSVLADTAYLLESILDPDAKTAAGSSIKMPENRLSEADARAIVTYVEALSNATP